MRRAFSLYLAALALTGFAALDYSARSDSDAVKLCTATYCVDDTTPACDSDPSCAYLAISLCEAGLQDICGFPGLPDAAIEIACGDAPYSLACRMRAEQE